jgi:hypothetical protein
VSRVLPGRLVRRRADHQRSRHGRAMSRPSTSFLGGRSQDVDETSMSCARPGMTMNSTPRGGVSVFWKAVLREVLRGAINLNPIVLRLFEDRYHGARVFRVCHRADGNGDQRGHVAEFPVDG